MQTPLPRNVKPLHSAALTHGRDPSLRASVGPLHDDTYGIYFRVISIIGLGGPLGFGLVSLLDNVALPLHAAFWLSSWI